MTESWPDAARAAWAEFDANRNHATVREAKAHLAQARQLAEMVPRLLDEISRRDMVLTRVRALLGTDCGMYDLPDDHLVPVSTSRAALDAEVPQ